MTRAAARVAALLLTIVAAALAEAPSLFIVGDSTASNAERLGWGTPFADYFDGAKVHVVNRARAGRSSRTFQTEGLWDAVLRDLKRGDFVLIQFGHNDGSAPDKDRARGSLPGLGEESQEFTMPNGTNEVVRTFGWYMRKYIADTKVKGATPIVLSLTVRNIWADGKVERGSGQFSQWSAAIAKSQVVDFIDLTNIAADRFEKIGPEAMKELFPIDHTHTSQAGADLNASLVISGAQTAGESPAARISFRQGHGSPDLHASARRC